MSLPRVSVVISTLDRAEHLANALAALDRQSVNGFEVIVVNGPSRDRSAAVIREYAGRVKSVECAEANLSMARNLGLAEAAGDLVAFLDDDAVPHPGWLYELAAPFVDPALGAVGGFVVGRNGLEYQARKIFCDRFGASHFVADWFDERAFPPGGSWAFPAPMGANMAFRRDALIAIRGFDEQFSYYLDETDVFLRLHDAGWSVRFAPDALVWHQFAGSRLRDDHATPREMVTLSRSKAYFVYRHGGDQPDAEAHLLTFQREKRGYLGRLRQEGKLAEDAHARLVGELAEGLKAGQALAKAGPRLRNRSSFMQAPDFHSFRGSEPQPLSVAFICRSFPPWSDAGIARWTSLAAKGLAARGATVHVVAEAREGPALWFEGGVWQHRIELIDHHWDHFMDRFEMTLDSAPWAATVSAYAPVLQAFHVDVVSFPIWDCEGIGLAESDALPCTLTLHTTSTLSRVEAGWTGEPAPETGMAKAEAYCLRAVPLIIANSATALQDIERSSGIPITAKSIIVPHGTPMADLAPEDPAKRPMQILFVGRAERRKGYDIALEAIVEALQAGVSIEATFAGGVFHHPLAQDLVDRDILKVSGLVDRSELDKLYREHDLLLVPSRYESFGLVAIEAMAHGLPVLATAAGGLSEIIIDGVNGHLVALEHHPAQAMAGHIVRLSQDRAALDRLRKGARHDAQARFALALMAERLEQAYRRAAESGKDTA